MGLHKKSVYPLEVKLEAIRLRQEGYSVKEIQKLLDTKSEYKYIYRDGEHHRLSQPIGKQYSNGLGTEASLMIRNEILDQQVKILKKHKKMERKWYEKYS